MNYDIFYNFSRIICSLIFHFASLNLICIEILLFVLIVFLFYHLINDCGCVNRLFNGFSVGAQDEPVPDNDGVYCEILKNMPTICKDTRECNNQKFNSCVLQKIDLRYANLEGAHFDNASLDNANLEGANLKGAKFNNAFLEGANLICFL